MLTVVNPNGTFSGVQYKEVKQEYINHHKQYGQKLVWVERRVEPGEKATPEDLAKEITVGDDVMQTAYLLDLDYRLSLLELGVR